MEDLSPSPGSQPDVFNGGLLSHTESVKSNAGKETGWWFIGLLDQIACTALRKFQIFIQSIMIMVLSYHEADSWLIIEHAR